MSTPYIGEIRMFAGNFAPRGFAFCNGQLMSISQNDALFALIGTTYGGDGQTTFALPNLQGRLPVHQGAGYVLGQMAGSESVTLDTTQIPAHSHAAQCQTAGSSQTGPGGGVWGSSALNPYSAGAPNVTMNSQNVGLSGGSQPHENRMPSLAISFVISLEGIFPSRN